jgi:hypothetical protein
MALYDAIVGGLEEVGKDSTFDKYCDTIRFC